MNPEAPKINPEYQPQVPERGEQLTSPERSIENSQEREQNINRSDQLAPPPPVSVPLPPPIAALPVITVAVNDDSTAPALANDDDVIEKEWVDNAKKIIAETQNDPYRREQEVNRLQTDYLRKRYGKELGVSN